MKKILLLLSAFVCLITWRTIAQSCLPGGIDFSTQAQIDAFPTNYSGCTEILGDVTISGGSITNLNGLSGVTSIGGNLRIDSDALTDLTGLGALTSIGGYLDIYDNHALTSLTGLGALTSIGGSLRLEYNTDLTDLTGLGALTSIGGSLLIVDFGTASLWGLGGITSIGDLLIQETDLTSLTGLETLTSIGGSLRISASYALTSLAALDALTSIGGDVEIYGNETLTNLYGLSNLLTVGGDVEIDSNPMLSSCCGIYPLLNNNGVAGTVTLASNPGFCNSVAEILNHCEDVCSGDIVLGSQADVDAFNCSEITGTLFISGSDINNLDALSSLTAVVGDIDIYNNNSLVSINGLSNLSTVGGNINIQSNNSLTNIDGLSGLVSVGSSLQFYYNDALTNLDGLSSLTNVALSFQIIGNAALTNIDGLSSLTNINGEVAIRENSSLNNVDGLSGLTYIPNVNVYFTENTALTNIDGLSNLTSVGGLELWGNAALINIDGLSNLTTVGGGLEIRENAALTNIDGLSNLTTVGGVFRISSNESLQKIDHLDNLAYVGGNWFIYNNPSLTSIGNSYPFEIEGVLRIHVNHALTEINLTSAAIIDGGLWIDTNNSLTTIGGFQLLTAIEGHGHLLLWRNPQLINIDGFSSLTTAVAVRIIENAALQNIDALSNLTTISDYIEIRTNPVLSNCCGIYPLLSNNGVASAVNIYDNPAFCSSAAEILDNCALLENYCLLATDSDVEFDESVIHDGGIGIMSSGDEAEIEDGAIVIAAGTFVKAPEIDVDGSSAVTKQFLAQASPDLPDFRYNDTNVNDDDEVNVDDGETVVLTGSVYEDIKVGDDATIIFSGQHDVYIEDLETEDDVTILFDQCTNLMLSGKIELGKDGHFNSSAMDVSVFAESHIAIERRNEVYGNLYSKKKLEVKKSSSSQTTKMHGFFIGREIEANEHGEYWVQHFDWNCNSSFSPLAAPVVTQSVQKQQLSLEKVADINSLQTVLKLYPNPANNVIHLTIADEAGKMTLVKIFNLQGALVLEKRFQNYGEEISFDLSQFTPGMYNILVMVDGKNPVMKKFVVQHL